MLGRNKGFVGLAIMQIQKIGILEVIVNFIPFYLDRLPITFCMPAVIAPYIP